jgi:hypothetical protein
MFIDQNGRVCADAETTFEEVKRLSETDIERLAENQQLLRDGLRSFDVLLASLPERQRRATLALLTKKIVHLLFDFHLSVATHVARQRIAVSATDSERMAALEEFIATTRDLELLYRK